jgi:anti-sigma regulatory factor (Ser/Thr protein kinase)
MVNTLFTSYLVEDRSFISFVKREIHNLVKHKFSEKRTAQIDIIISELTSNLIKHAGGGELLYRLILEGAEPAFEVLSIDNGPGMKDVANSSRDGVSTANTLGQGIGSILRFSNISQIYSQEGWGTVFYSKVFENVEKKNAPHRVIIRSICVCKPGELVSGDGFCVKTENNRTRILVADGLGHGPHAKEAVDVAINSFTTSVEEDASENLKELHEAVKKTRGFVGTIAVLDHQEKKLQLCGIGNIATRVYKGLEYKNYVCHNGVVGMNIPSRLLDSTFEFEKYQQIILCSDGIKTRWDLIRYPSILKYDPIILAAAIYKDQARRNDDMSVVIIKLA